MWETNQELIKSFKSLYKELENANFIMSNEIITKILKFITTNEPLYFAYKHASQNFNFESIFQEVAANGRFKLPDDEYKTIVFVTKLLFDIDRGKIEYFNFLKNTFPRVDLNDSYNDFCKSIVYPYVLAFEKLLSKADRVVAIEGAAQIQKLPQQLMDLFQSNIVSVYDHLQSVKSLAEPARQELIVILEGLSYAVENGNAMLIKSQWLGLKYALLANRAYTSQVRAFENELKNYSII